MQSTDDTLSTLKHAAKDEIDDARERLSGAAQRLRSEAANAGSTVSSLVMDELDRRMGDVSRGLRDMIDRVRDPGTAVGEPPQMFAQALDVLDDLSARMEGQSARDMADRLSRFGRDNPALFLMGCLAVGLCAGRIAVARSEADGDAAFGTARGDHGGRPNGSMAGPGGVAAGGRDTMGNDPFSGGFQAHGGQHV